MKVLLCAIFLYCASLSCRGQVMASARPASVSPLIAQSGQRVLYKISKPPGMRMRNTGMALAIAGGAMITGGVIVASQGDSNKVIGYDNNGVPITDEEGHHAVGAVMIFLGTGMAVPGTILWIRGQRKLNRAMENQTSIQFHPTGLTLRHRF